MHLDFSWAKRAGRASAVLLLLGLTAQTDIGEPFGLAAVTAPEGTLWTTWRRLQAESEAERPAIAQCRAKPQACHSAPARKFIAIVDAGAPFQGLSRIGHINRAANLAIRAVDSATLAGYRDKWTSPLAALKAGMGNCKQYAVLKYAALQAAGFATGDLRIVIVRLRAVPEAHAVVAVRQAGHWFILDNRSMAIADSRDLRNREVPLYAFDRRGVSEYVPQLTLNSNAACAKSG
jgi:predicted transglutaminase-like cysteine proteinase